MSDKLYDLIIRGVLIQGLITLVLIGTIVYLAVTGQDIPDVLINLTAIAVGFYLGGESTARITRANAQK
jgi:hypothetical protein